MKTKIILGFTLIFFACNSHYRYWDLSKFKMDSNALEHLEEIKLLYSSRCPEGEEGKSYIQVVVVSQKTGDTVNILTSVDNGFRQEDGERIFNFLSLESPDTKAMFGDKYSAEKPTKVARDPAYDKIADNQFPTVIGLIAEHHKPNP